MPAVIAIVSAVPAVIGPISIIVRPDALDALRGAGRRGLRHERLHVDRRDPSGGEKRWNDS